MWVAESYFEILGTRFAVRATDSEYLAPVDRVLEHFLLDHRVGVPASRRFALAEARAVKRAVGDGEILVYRDCRRVGPAGSLGSALTRLVTSLNRQAIDEFDGFAVHAGVISLDGEAIAFPNTSGGGKSTLTAACVEAGFDYVSDEALCIDVRNGLVIPYPKPIALSDRSVELLGLSLPEMSVAGSGLESLVTAQDLGGDAATSRLSLRHIVLSQFGHDRVELQEVAASEAMVALLTLSFNHYKLGQEAFRLAAALASQARVWRLFYDHPVTAAAVIRERLGRQSLS